MVTIFTSVGQTGEGVGRGGGVAARDCCPRTPSGEVAGGRVVVVDVVLVSGDRSVRRVGPGEGHAAVGRGCGEAARCIGRCGRRVRPDGRRVRPFAPAVVVPGAHAHDDVFGVVRIERDAGGLNVGVVVDGSVPATPVVVAVHGVVPGRAWYRVPRRGDCAVRARHADR